MNFLGNEPPGTPLNGVTSDDFVLAERVSSPTSGGQDNSDDKTSEEDDESDADEFCDTSDSPQSQV